MPATRCEIQCDQRPKPQAPQNKRRLGVSLQAFQGRVNILMPALQGRIFQQPIAVAGAVKIQQGAGIALCREGSGLRGNRSATTIHFLCEGRQIDDMSTYRAPRRKLQAENPFAHCAKKTRPQCNARLFVCCASGH